MQAANELSNRPFRSGMLNYLDKETDLEQEKKFGRGPVPKFMSTPSRYRMKAVWEIRHSQFVPVFVVASIYRFRRG